MTRCSFCGGTVPLGRGKIFVKASGQVFNFCNSKCERNWKMGREGKERKWTQSFRKTKQ